MKTLTVMGDTALNMNGSAHEASDLGEVSTDTKKQKSSNGGVAITEEEEEEARLLGSEDGEPGEVNDSVELAEDNEKIEDPEGNKENGEIEQAELGEVSNGGDPGDASHLTISDVKTTDDKSFIKLEPGETEAGEVQMDQKPLGLCKVEKSELPDEDVKPDLIKLESVKTEPGEIVPTVEGEQVDTSTKEDEEADEAGEKMDDVAEPGQVQHEAEHDLTLEVDGGDESGEDKVDEDAENREPGELVLKNVCSMKDMGELLDGEPPAEVAEDEVMGEVENPEQQPENSKETEAIEPEKAKQDENLAALGEDDATTMDVDYPETEEGEVPQVAADEGDAPHTDTEKDNMMETGAEDSDVLKPNEEESRTPQAGEEGEGEKTAPQEDDTTSEVNVTSPLSDKIPRKRKRTEDLTIEEAALVDTDDEDADDPSPIHSPLPSPSPEDDSEEPDSEEADKGRKRSLSPSACSDDDSVSKRSRMEAAEDSTAVDAVAADTDSAEPEVAKDGRQSAIVNGHMEEAIDRVASLPLSFIKTLKGTLANLTRSDLEELVVQKLCEVVTERSNVGELRRRAQTLEQEQEKWKEQSRALFKQMREMEMVMKKYQSEVQKQLKEKTGHVVAPLRVTRSVGLQVALSSKSPKTHTVQTQERRGVGRPPMHPRVAPPATSTPPVPQPPSSTPPGQPRKLPTLSPKPSQGSANIPPGSPKRRSILLPTPPPALLPAPAGRPPQPQPSPTRPATAVKSPHKQALPSASRGVIDLTDEDDRQTPNGANVANGFRPQSNVRMVNNYNPAGNRVAYLLPTNATVPGAPSGSRQVLIATATQQQPSPRQTIPPLVYKGGSFVPAMANQQVANNVSRPVLSKYLKHPAPLPPPPPNQVQRPSWKYLPPRPSLKISKVQTGIVLSWNMQLGPDYEQIASYQLYAYQEANVPPTTNLWKKVGDVKALPLPMACTLTQFMTGHKYHFAVRAVDVHSRIGQFSLPGTIVLVK